VASAHQPVDRRPGRGSTLIDWYHVRWEIELYFHVLKNGCRVEALQLTRVKRLERALAPCMVVA
jgi:hypothetical protein